jgi:hypothetical protein
MNVDQQSQNLDIGGESQTLPILDLIDKDDVQTTTPMKSTTTTIQFSRLHCRRRRPERDLSNAFLKKTIIIMAFVCLFWKLAIVLLRILVYIRHYKLYGYFHMNYGFWHLFEYCYLFFLALLFLIIVNIITIIASNKLN